MVESGWIEQILGIKERKKKKKKKKKTLMTMTCHLEAYRSQCGRIKDHAWDHNGEDVVL